MLNEAFEEVAPGEWGELCLGGAGLARGYWNRPELTAEKFPLHPRLGRIYRTGDLAHRDAAGHFYSHGRIDSQVKIRGHRVELEEIESHLAACAGVRAAACRMEGESLAAFLVPEDPQAPPSFEALRSALRETLPAHMVPARFDIIAGLPVTVGGKIDRARLPSGAEGWPARRRNRFDPPPRDPTEARLADAVRDILGLPAPPSIHADFFSGLGGDSLRAAQLVTRLRREVPSTSIAVRDVYEAPTIARLAERLGETDSSPVPSRDRLSSSATAPSEPLSLAARPSGRPLLATVLQVVSGSCWASRWQPLPPTTFSSNSPRASPAPRAVAVASAGAAVSLRPVWWPTPFLAVAAAVVAKRC